MLRHLLLAAGLATGLIGSAQAADTPAAQAANTPAAQAANASPIKIGFISTFSGPEGALGRELADGFKLGLKYTDQKLGGRPVDVIYGDDQTKPDIGRQLAEKMLESDHVSIVTGINFSNVLLAVAKPVLDAGAFYVSINAGPSQYAGKQCNPHFFSASFQNDTLYESMGIYMQKENIPSVYLMAPNYPAGRDMMTGFKRYYKGKILGEDYTTFGALDYAVNIAEIRAKQPKAVLVFYPGGMGINFVKQYTQAGLKDQIPLYSGGGVFDQTALPAMGDAALGVKASALWSEYLDNSASKRFATDFEAEYNRIPSPYAAQAYDGVLLLDAALKSINGKVEDKDAFQKSMEQVKFNSVRGDFHFNTNHFPIQDFYLTTIAKDDKGRDVAKLDGTIVKDLKDSYAAECPMK